ncbi:uncharacterized protein C8Q71DRAFT_396670 [Rhodofomes roseus]|uniref:N-acetyltransferase domain-containing protein n=1 Tax=Rhodofomes roseus TaxID=34475 RepID=A0ABQ8JZD2_9APHY|nr:uncharacterized protein C8Q71DRAFT_396670 [Rhodofomes roseus]KAH9829665.1 hypothetical protein C8Q71DRAFT_396670 [Rhodofomes roseus]
MTTFGASAEQKRRIKETSDKEEAAVKEAFGDESERMFQVHGPGTRPDRQRRGYGNMLMAMANAEADELGVESYVVTSAHNVKFYESCGYVVAKRFFVGEGNPA